jgi:proline racemase
VPIRHPLVPELDALYGTIVDGPPRDPANHQANLCVFAEREVDRSPTGTGTAGRVAQLVARGALAIGDELRNESIVGSVFAGRALEHTRVGPFEAVVPEVRGRAAIMGHATWLVEHGDELGAGFFLR